MARKTWRPFQPTYTPGTYTRVGISALEDADLTREYSRIRREVTERNRSFIRSKDEEVRIHAATLANQYGLGSLLKYGGEASSFPTLKQIKDMTGMDPRKGGGRALMEDLIIEGYRFVSAKTSSVSGFNAMRDKQVNSLQAAGYTFVNRKNLRQFGEFMDYSRNRAESRRWGSNTIATAFNQAAKQKISPEELEKHFQFYVSQIAKGAEKITRAKSETKRGRR